MPFSKHGTVESETTHLRYIEELRHQTREEIPNTVY